MAINKNKVQLQETVLDSNGHPLSSTDVNPLTSSDCVIMENGMTLEDVMGNDTVIDTPTIMNEDTSFKVGIGDSETKVIDSDVAKMVIEGKTYQNILPKPTTLIMNTDEKEFKINDKIDSSIVLDDNVAEIATIKGQTYVNVVQEESASEYVAIDEELNGQSITTTGKPEGYVKNATLEGLTLVNTIQEPSGADATVLDLDADINAQSATIDNTVQGGIKSAILSGCTLVNLCLDNYTLGNIADDGKDYIEQIFPIGASYPQHSHGYNTVALKPNTTYLAIPKYYTDVPDTRSLVRDQTNSINLTSADVNDRGIVKFTTKDLPCSRISYYNMIPAKWGANASTQEWISKLSKKIMIIEYVEGMENWDIPYFEGMKSVEVPSVMTTGKNLLDKDINFISQFGLTFDMVDNKLIVNGIATDTVDWRAISKAGNYNLELYEKVNSMPVGTTLILSNNLELKNYFAVTRNGGTTYLDDTITIQDGDTDINCFIRFQKDSSYDNVEFKPQLEIGSIATSYEPYKSSTLTTPSDVVLRKVGDVQDELDLTTGKLTQRIGEVVLNGSLTPATIDTSKDNTIEVSFGRQTNMKIASGLMCDKLPNAEPFNTDVEGICCHVLNGNFHFNILKSKIENHTKQGVVDYLSQNPITVQYELETPTVKTVDLIIKDQDNNPLKTIQTHPTLTHVSTSSNGLIPFVSIPSQLKYPTIIKPSTQYTVQLKQTTVNSEFPLTINLGGAIMAVPSAKFTITTPETLTSQDVIFTGKNNVIGEVVITEGDTTGIDYGFFEGMNDVKSPKMIAAGKNLFDYSSHPITLEKLAYTDGQQVYWTGYIGVKTYVPVKENTTYTYSNDINVGIHFGLVFYDGDKSVLSYINIFETNNSFTSFTTPKGCKFIRFAMETQTIPQWIQLEEGSTTTSYEPYKGVTIEQSIDSIPLTSDMFEQGNILADNIVIGSSYQQIGRQSSTARISAKTLIKVKPNCTYTLQSDNIKMWMMAFDKNGGYIKNMELSNTITTDANTYYLGLKLQYTDDSTITPSTLDSLNLTLQEVTDEIVLRSIGDVKDTLNLTTGEYVQRIGEIVLDGSASAYWDIYRKEYHGVGKSTFQAYCTSGIPKTFFNDKIYCDILCQGDLLINGNIDVNKYPCNYIHNYTDGTYTVNKFFVSINKEMFGCTSNDDYDTCFVRFKAWVKDNPITVQYKLATPIIKKVNLTNTTKLPSYNSTTHYDTIVPSNSLAPNIKIPSTIDYNVAIKPSTQYTIRANTSDNLTVDLGGTTGTLSNGKVTLTTPATLTHNEVKFSGTGKAKEVMVIEGSEIKDNVPFFNGMKNVQMGGIKLVNIARGAVVNSLVSSNANGTQYTYTSNGSTSWGDLTFDKALLKPNTVYTIYMNIVSNTSDNGIKIQLANGKDGVLNINKGTTGIIKQAIVSAQKLVDSDKLGIYFRNSSTSGQQTVIQNPMIIEGDWTHLDEIPYIESEMIIEQPIIRSQGKNLFDGNFIVGDINTTTGNYWGGTTWKATDYIKVKNKGKIVFSSSIAFATANFAIFKYDKDKKYIGYQGAYDNFTTATFNLENSVRYIKIRVPYDVPNDTNIQIEEGSSATTYEPFKQHTLSSNRVIGYEEGVHYGGITGIKSFNADFNSVMADVEGLSIAYVTNGSSNFSFWDKDMVFISGKSYLDTSLSSDNKNGFIQVPSNAKYMKFASSNFTSNATYYAKATVTGELPLRSLPNGVCDSLNLVTGEYVQRVGEIVLDGSKDNVQHYASAEGLTTSLFLILQDNVKNVTTGQNGSRNCYCDKFIEELAWANSIDIESIWLQESNTNNILRFRIKKSKLQTVDNNGIKQYLSQNPITVQYELETPIVRKIGLTAKGNYREQVLDGSEEVGQNPQISKKFHVYRLNLANDGQSYTLFTNNERFKVENSYNDYTIYKYKDGSELVLVINSDINSIALFKQWLSQNPLKVGYLSTNSTSLYSNIRKPIFFNDVNVQFLPYNLDIQPTLTLQARSMNSYVMDMMKANTTYTMKCLSYSDSARLWLSNGTANTSVATNKSFSFAQSSLDDANKQLVIVGQWYEPMIIEGDVTGKNLPYFKGIRSSFDNTDEIEIYSANKNLFDNSKAFPTQMQDNGFKIISENDYMLVTGTPTATYTSFKTNLTLEPGTYNLKIFINGIENNDNSRLWIFNGGSSPEKVVVGDTSFIIGGTGRTLRIVVENYTVGTPIVGDKIQFVITRGTTNENQNYIPHKENSTIINMPMQFETVEVVKPVSEDGALEQSNGSNCISANNSEQRFDYIPVQPNDWVLIYNNSEYRPMNCFLYDINKNFIKYAYTDGRGLTVPKDCYFIRGYSSKTNTSNLNIAIQREVPTALNSLPNGVKDELIINRATSSAKLIRRVGKVVLDGFSGGHDETVAQFNFRKFVIYTGLTSIKVAGQCVTSDNLPCIVDGEVRNTIRLAVDGKIVINIDGFSSINEYFNYLQQDPITIYYELAEPIVTEIRLKGYPFVYEDGSISLNTDIAPVTRTSYNVNQHQLINSQNETIIRHDKQISDLYDYIEIYLDEIYRMELFKMQLELSL